MAVLSPLLGPLLHLLCLRSQGEAFPAQRCGRCNRAFRLPRQRVSLLHMRYLLLSAETVFCTGAREAARCRKASPAQKLRVLRTQLSAVQLGMEMKAETAPEKSRSTGQNPRRPWGPPVTCSQLVLLGYLGFLEARLNWNHWIGSGRKQTDNLRCDS